MEDEISPFSSKYKNVCKVGRFERTSKGHWLFEINCRVDEGKNPLFVLFVYISPRELTDEEELRLKDFKNRDPEYVQGVREGWSLLFLGRKHMEPIILPGVVSRDKIVGTINEIIWQKLEGREYRFLDGAQLRQS